jgi:hypothetical protein
MKQFVTLFLLASTGCMVDFDGEDQPPPDETEVDQDIAAANGTSLNGTSLNGTSATARPQRIEPASTPSAGHNSSARINANTTAMPPLVGSTMIVRPDRHRVERRDREPPRRQRGAGHRHEHRYVVLYAVSYQNTVGWAAVRPDGGASRLGRPRCTAPDATAKWTTSTTGGRSPRQSSSKCVEWATSGRTTEPAGVVHADAGVADYCGTGTSATVDGTLINVYDNVGVRPTPRRGRWKWRGHNGAKCIKAASPVAGPDGQTPSCLATKSTSTCGSSWSGVYLMDEYN